MGTVTGPVSQGLSSRTHREQQQVQGVQIELLTGEGFPPVCPDWR